MPPLSTEPGQQLHSVATRYCSPLRAVVSAGGWSRIQHRGSSQFSGSIALGNPGTAGAAESAATDHPHRRDADLARLEAVLLLAREPVSSRKLAQFAGLADGTQARTLVRRLNAHYDAAGRAFRVEQVAGGYQLLSRRKFAPWLRRLAHVPGESRMSAPALETLAVIAYRQPVPRADIEAIRGVNCGEILRQLLDRDLVRVGGRSEELGRPFLYATTKRFLALFGLIDLENLPRGDLLRHAPLPAAGTPVTILAEHLGHQDSGEPAAVDEPWPEPDTSDEELLDDHLTE
jgi:segregation and condensation protein B